LFSPEGRELGLKIMDHLRDKLQVYQKENGSNV